MTNAKLEDLVAQAPPDEPRAQADVSRSRTKPKFSFCGCFSKSSTGPRPSAKGSPPKAGLQSEEVTVDVDDGLPTVDANGEPITYFLEPQVGRNVGRKTLVLDLDETLVHSSFRPVKAPIVLEVEIDGAFHKVYVLKRPGCDEFLSHVLKLYEVVIYTASMAKYADPLVDILDPKKETLRLFRESCSRVSGGGYVKDLSLLGRDLRKVSIVDNSPTCYSLQPHNAIPIKTWRGDPDDTELLDLIPILEALVGVDDVPATLKWVLTADLPEDEALSPSSIPGRQSSVGAPSSTPKGRTSRSKSPASANAPPAPYV